MPSLMPHGRQQYFDANGNPLAGGRIYTYEAGTSTPLATYSDAAGATPNANPVVLNARGEASIWWGDAPYKIVVKDASDVEIYTQDNAQAPIGRADLASTANGKGAALVSFLPSGAGAVSRTVQAKARDIVSRADYDTNANYYAAGVAQKTGGFWADGTPSGRAWRFSDRMFIGGAVDNDGNLTNVTKDWLETERSSTTNNSQHAVLSTIGQMAIIGGSRTSDSPNAGSMGCIGITGFAVNDNATQVQTAYASYFESRRKAGAGITHGIELDIVNQGSVVGAHPALAAPAGATLGLWVASGGGVPGAATASVAIGIINNGATFDKGILFQTGSLAGEAGGEGVAMAMAATHGIVWYDGSGGKVARIRCDATTASLGIVFGNGTTAIQTMAGASLWTFDSTGQCQLGGTPKLKATSTVTFDMPNLNFSNFTTAATVGAAGGASALPAAPLTYIQFQVNGTNVKVPCYNV